MFMDDDGFAEADSFPRIFDQSFLPKCPTLSAVFTIPKYFSVDLARKWKGEKPSQPSMFIDRAGVKGGLHVDTLGTGFWMFVLAGEKQFRAVNESVQHYLRGNSEYDQHVNTFQVDLWSPDYSRYPAMRFVQGLEATLR